VPESESLKLLRVLGGSYRPGSAIEAARLAERTRLNKLYLAFLRALGVQRKSWRGRRPGIAGS
jgi:hypothetical protein